MGSRWLMSSFIYAMYKLRMADRIQEEYKYTLPYELGLLASGIMDRFRHMLRVYRFYSNHKAFKVRKHSVNELLNAYSIMQSDYNEIRAERDLYLEVIDLHRLKKEEDTSLFDLFAAQHPDKFKKPGETKTTKGRRSMGVEQNFTKPEKEGILELIAKKDGFKLHANSNGKKEYGWTKNENNTEEAEYKKKLRYIMWAESWKGFNPETEGIHIPDPIARVGLANESNFLLKELKGNL